MAKILTPAQAEAVFMAMCHLNNVSGILHTRFPQGGGAFLHVKENTRDQIQVWVGDACGNPAGPCEDYFGQHSFAAAYGLL